MTVDDHAALAAMGKKMAKMNGYHPMQSSGLYITDGDEIDWAYGSQRIWMYTFELYPSHAKVGGLARFYPADELIERETDRNRSAILYLIERASCRYSILGKAKTHCGPLFEDFETAHGLGRRPAPHRHRHRRRVAARQPGGDARQAGTVPSGSRALVTGQAGRLDGAVARRRRRRDLRRARGSSACPRRRARCRSSTTSRTARTRRPPTTSGPTSNARTARARW